MRNRTCSSGNNNIIAYNKVVRYCVTDTSVLIAVGCQPLNIAHTVSLSVCLSLSLSLSLSLCWLLAALIKSADFQNITAELWLSAVMD